MADTQTIPANPTAPADPIARGDRSAPAYPAAPAGQPAPPYPVSLAAVSRAVVSAAADLVTNVQRAVVGEQNVRSARDNAWDAMLADQARNQARADLTREVAAQLARRAAHSHNNNAKTPHIVRG